MKGLLSTALLFCLSVVAYADDAETINQNMVGYWAAFTQPDLARAASYMHPEDLAMIQQEIVPVFLEAAESQDAETRFMAETFFQGVPEGSRSWMTGEQAFIGLNLVLRAGAPEAFEALRASTISVTDVRFTSSTEAIVYYDIALEGFAGSDMERLGKLQDQWYLRSKEPVQDTVEQFRQLLLR